MSKHATVRLPEYANPIPLIGIDPKETKERCCKCGHLFHLQDIKLDWDGKPKCKKCLK